MSRNNEIPLYTKDGCDVKCYWCNGRFPEVALAGVEGEYIHRDCAEEEDFATEWEKDLTIDERVALLAKTFDNKVDSDDEEEEEEETWRCEECGRDDMKKEDIGGHLIDGGCVCNDCYKEEDEVKMCFGEKNAHKIEHL